MEEAVRTGENSLFLRAVDHADRSAEGDRLSALYFDLPLCRLLFSFQDQHPFSAVRWNVVVLKGAAAEPGPCGVFALCIAEFEISVDEPGAFEREIIPCQCTEIGGFIRAVHAVVDDKGQGDLSVLFGEKGEGEGKHDGCSARIDLFLCAE